MSGRRSRAIRKLAGVKHARLAERDLWWLDLPTSTLEAWVRYRRTEGSDPRRLFETGPA